MFELPKGFELPKPANDNFAEAEQRRMSSLEGSQKTIEEVRDWMHKKREQLVSSSSSEAKDLRAQEVESVLEMLESVLAEADSAVSLAQNDLGSPSTFDLAAAAVYRLEASFAEAQSVAE